MSGTNSDGRSFSLYADRAQLQRNGLALSDVVFSIPDVVVVNRNISGLYISVSNAYIPTTWYNVDVLNSEMRFSLLTGGVTTTYSLVVPSRRYGTYDVDSFMVLLNDLFKVYQPDPVLTFTYNAFNSRTEVVWKDGIPTHTFTMLSTTMGTLLGYVLGVDTQFSSPAVKQFSKCVNFSGVTSYFFVCAELPTQNFSTELNSNFLFKVVPASGNFNSTEWNNVTLDATLIPSRIQVSQLSIRVFDQNGRLLNFNGVPWNFTLRINYSLAESLDYKSFVANHSSLSDSAAETSSE